MQEVPYMAPEVYSGKPIPEKARDVYAFLLYRLAEPSISWLSFVTTYTATTWPSISGLSFVTTYTAPTSTTFNHARGTLPYMAPEVYSGKPVPEKARDVYAFLLYRLAEPSISFLWEEEISCSSVNKMKNWSYLVKGPHYILKLMATLWP